MPATVTTGVIAAKCEITSPGFSFGRQFVDRLARQVEHGQLLILMPSGEAIHRAGPRFSGQAGPWCCTGGAPCAGCCWAAISLSPRPTWMAIGPRRI